MCGKPTDVTVREKSAEVEEGIKLEQADSEKEGRDLRVPKWLVIVCLLVMGVFASRFMEALSASIFDMIGNMLSYSRLAENHPLIGAL